MLSQNYTADSATQQRTEIRITSGAGDYDVIIEEGVLQQVLQDNPKAIVICDERLASHCNTHEKMITIPATEQAKDLQNISSVILQMKQFALTRNGMIIGIGGGVIQDIACFVSSIYMRGVKWLYFPTTFLGMADSCIGGKSSINVSGYKNLVGNFYPPQSIYIDGTFIDSLPEEQILAGVFEAIKICFCHADKAVFTQCEKLLEKGLNKQSLIEVLTLSLSAKKWFIEVDEFDKKERQLLNFGHTFGHAIEGACGYQVPHGIAVGFGMLWSLHFTSACDKEPLSPHAEHLKSVITPLLNKVPHYHDIVKKTSFADVMEKFKADKKHTDENFCCILPKASAERVFLPKNEQTVKLLESTFHEI